MEIEKLRLAKEEIEGITARALREWVIEGTNPVLEPHLGIEIAEAQLAKALWGVVDWLSFYDDFAELTDALGFLLYDAGIERPKEE